MLRVFLFVFLIAAGARVAAQNPLLDEQLKSYEAKFKNLMGSRGLQYEAGEVNQTNLVDIIGSYCTQTTGEKNTDLALLFYHFENDTLFHWVLDATGVRARTKLAVTVDSLLALENTIKYNIYRDNRLGELLEDVRGQYQATEKKYRLRSKEVVPLISRILLPDPVARVLATKKYLIVLPILNISSFPFGMLQPWGAKKNLIDQLSFSFAHNFTQFFKEADPGGIAQNYRVTSSKAVFTPHKALVVGNPLFADACTAHLRPLPGAEEEARNVATRLGTSAKTGAQVTLRQTVASMKQSNFIYLATHGWADAVSPLDKSYLALYDSGGCGRLTPRQVQSYKLSKEPLVFLSACQSGLGSVHEAGIIGLARGFLKAGAQSVTMSLWNVDDAQTATLMRLYLEELEKPHFFFPAEHWRQAVLRYRQRHEDDPMYWAAFQHFGVPFRLLAPTHLQP